MCFVLSSLRLHVVSDQGKSRTLFMLLCTHLYHRRCCVVHNVSCWCMSWCFYLVLESWMYSILLHQRFRAGPQPGSEKSTGESASKHGVLNQCRFDVGPASQTLAQHQNSIDSMSCVCWVAAEARSQEFTCVHFLFCLTVVTAYFSRRQLLLFALG